MILENYCKPALKRSVFNGCAQLSVNVEETESAGFCGLRRKNTVNDARYLARGWKTQNGPKRGCTLAPALPNERRRFAWLA